MLREGWDVRNVCVIVTLRALSAANKILPEQALGRGLRRMTPPGSGFDERVVVIEHEAFRNLWNAELDGGLDRSSAKTPTRSRPVPSRSSPTRPSADLTS